MRKNIAQSSFSYNNPDVKRLLIKYILIHYSVVLLLVVFYYTSTLVNMRNVAAVRYLVLIQIGFMIYQSVPVISDLLKNKAPLLNFDGRIVNAKGIFIRTLSLRDVNRKKMKLITDSNGVKLGVSIKGTCTRYGKVIVAYKIK